MSNRDELLDEAITKAKEAEDWQLVEWLRMARGCESAARWYTKRLRELEVENDRLRELVRIAATYCVNGYCEDGCPLSIGKFACELSSRVRELGIEVDDAS